MEPIEGNLPFEPFFVQAFKTGTTVHRLTENQLWHFNHCKQTRHHTLDYHRKGKTCSVLWKMTDWNESESDVKQNSAGSKIDFSNWRVSDSIKFQEDMLLNCEDPQIVTTTSHVPQPLKLSRKSFIFQIFSFLGIILLPYRGSVLKMSRASTQTPSASTLGDNEVTSKVYIMLRFANETKLQRMVFGLYGNDAPVTVKEFEVAMEKPQGNEQPYSYVKSRVSKCVKGSFVEVGKLANLNTITMRNEVFFEYAGKLTLSKPQTEQNKLKHSRRGLLSREILHLGPEFLITLGPQSSMFDQTHTVFGTLIEGYDVLNKLEELPVETGRSMQPEGSFLGEVFQAQKSFMLNFGRNVLKDQRALEVYDNKILRRVEIIDCGLLRR